jgi:hypothetical protein
MTTNLLLKSLFKLSLLVSVVLATAQQPAPKVDLAALRKEMTGVVAAWDHARTTLDKATMEKMLAPDFYVQLGEKKMTRKEFIDGSAQVSERVKLARFHTDIMPVTPKNDLCELVITEKLEYEIKMPDGKTDTVYSLWITRDGWAKTDAGWTAKYSEAIGNQNWRNQKPPITAW